MNNQTIILCNMDTCIFLEKNKRMLGRTPEGHAKVVICSQCSKDKIKIDIHHIPGFTDIPECLSYKEVS